MGRWGLVADWLAPVFAQVDPGWVLAFDEGDFSVATPTFDFLLAGDGSVRRCVSLKPDEAMAPVRAGEAAWLAASVFACASLDAVRYADIEDTRAAGNDVGVVTAVRHALRLMRGTAAVLMPEVMWRGVWARRG